MATAVIYNLLLGASATRCEAGTESPGSFYPQETAGLPGGGSEAFGGGSGTRETMTDADAIETMVINPELRSNKEGCHFERGEESQMLGKKARFFTPLGSIQNDNSKFPL
jgi:hypothetical protein